jgi:hypothetical protein
VHVEARRVDLCGTLIMAGPFRMVARPAELGEQPTSYADRAGRPILTPAAS